MTLEHLHDVGSRPGPIVHPDTAEFWSGLAQGELRVQVCTNCGLHRFPFGPVCFQCLSFDHTWQPISPAGRVAVAVIVHRASGDQQWAAHVPFLSGLVDMEDGLRLPGRIVCTCRAALQRGTPVRAVVLAAPDGGAAVHAFAHACAVLSA